VRRIRKYNKNITKNKINITRISKKNKQNITKNNNKQYIKNL
jgi:hypothetical protein